MPLLKGVVAGHAIGADAIGRYLAPEQRARLLAQLSEEVAERNAALIEEARAAAAAIRADAEAAAMAIRARAEAEGYAAGRATGFTEGQAEGLSAVEPLAALLTEAVRAAESARQVVLDSMEEDVLALALQAAQRVVGAAAESHADLAVETVREGLRSAPGRVLRIRVNPADADSVAAALVAEPDAGLVSPDGSVEIGGCVIHVEGGTIDLRLGVQMESIASLLRGDTA